MGAKHNKCCCDCEIAADDFNRADNTDTGSLWTQGNAEIVDQQLEVSAITSLTTCSPTMLGSLRALVTLRECATDGPFVIRLGDPAGSVEVTATFAGTFGAGGTMTIECSDGTDSASYAYDWEEEDEQLIICYHPETQLTCGPAISRDSEAPQWVTICLDEVGAPCWDSGTKGNWHFISGTFDDFSIEVHKLERQICLECDCHCFSIVDGNRVAWCIPPLIHLTLSTACPDISGTYEMIQSRAVSVVNNAPPTTAAWPQKFEWISAVIQCPAADSTVHRFCFILRCNLGDAIYPKFTLRLVRWGTGLTCSGLGFDPDDDDTITPSAQGDTYFDSDAFSTSASTCDPFTLYFPDIIESDFGCSNCWEDPDPPSSSPIACCGGCVVSGVGFSDPTYMSVIITE